jgi:type I restriction enzyme S subunit
VPDGVPVITIGALGEGAFFDSQLLYVSEATAKSLAAYAVRPGDIVFSRVADVGRSVVVAEPQHGWLMSSNLMWIAVDQRRSSPLFVQTNISANSMVLPWPPLHEQERIAAIRIATEGQLTKEATALGKLRVLKQGLMEDLLTGRVRVNTLVDEAAA